MHTHALPLLAGHPFPLSFLAIFPLIVSSCICTISACQTSSLSPYALSALPVLTLLYPEPHTLLSFPLPLPYHQSLTHSLSLTFSCTTTYSLVCAHFLQLYKPYIPQLYSLTWIYLVLPSYLVHNLLSLISLYLWSLALLWSLVIAS